MAKMTLKGFEEYEARLSKLDHELKQDVIGRAVWEGARVVADEIRKATEALPVITGYGTPDHPLPGGVTKAQKAGLLDGLGVSHIRDDHGYINAKIDFWGYNDTKTEKWPKGQPNQLVARGVESGASWKQKKPFVRPTVNRSKNRAIEAMKKEVDKELKKIMK